MEVKKEGEGRKKCNGGRKNTTGGKTLLPRWRFYYFRMNGGEVDANSGYEQGGVEKKKSESPTRWGEAERREEGKILWAAVLFTLR